MKFFLRLLLLSLATLAAARAQTLAISQPLNGASVLTTLGGSVTVAGTASGVTGTVTVSVVNPANVTSTVSATISGSTWSTSFTPATVGTYSLKASASSGAVTSSTVLVTVSGFTPSVTLALSGGGASIPSGSSRFVVATATDDGAIDHVDFALDGTVFATVSKGQGNNYAALFTASATTGGHQITATAYDNDGNSTVATPLIITVSNAIGTLPTVGVNGPIDGAFLATGVATTITGIAQDGDGTITGVQVFANGSAIGAATLASNGIWTISWTPSSTGVTSLVAIATDDKANAVASPAVGINVTDASSPTIALAATPGTSTLPSGATRNILATATPSAGRAIVRVEFFVNGAKVGEKTVAPYSYRFAAPTTTGSYVISARATDNTGSARDAQLALTVIAAVGTAPTVNLLTPTNGTVVVPNTALSVAASALSTGGSIASVQFYANGSPASINGGNALSASPYVSSFTPTAPGSYVIDAIATDDRGNTTVSNAATITAAFGTPTITITTPSTAATARATPAVPFNVTTSATAGTGAQILLVELLVDGVQVLTRTTPNSGNTTSGTYQFAWTPATANIGTHQVTARVTDTNSQVATSTVLNVNVAAAVGSPPQVGIAVSPVPSLGLQTASQVNFVATAIATASGATISSVEFFLNDASVGTAARQGAANSTAYRLVYDFNRFDFTQLTPNINANTGAVSYSLPLYAIAKDSAGNQTVSTTATLTVNAATGSPPGVTIATLAVGPGGGTGAVTAGTPVLVIATVTSSTGTVQNLQLFSNGGTTALATQANPQQNALLTFTPSAAGTFSLYAVATDDSGITGVSNVVNLTVNGATQPTSTLVRPADDATTTSVGAPVFLEANAASTNTGQLISSVVFINSATGATLATGTAFGTTGTYRAIWTPTAAQVGTVTLAARATDTVGASATSTISRRVVVNNLVGIAPVVSLVGLPSSTTTASTLNLVANATRSGGAVIDVEFFVNRNSVGHAVRDQVANTWRLTSSFIGAQTGSTEVVALARDDSGNVAASPTSTITVNAATGTGPSIAITPSSTNVAFSRQVQLTSVARVTSGTGTISTVQYFQNGTSIGTSGNSATSYQVNWTPTQSGTFNVYGLATDSNGNTSLSTEVQVTVRRNNPILDDDAFILQTYTDIANTNLTNNLILADLDSQLAAGTLTRAQLASSLTTQTGFAAPVNLLAAYYVIMGQWPTPANYQTLLATARGSLANACGAIISSVEYVAKYPEHVTPTVTLLNSPTSAIPAQTFLTRLRQNAGLGAPSALELVQFMNNTTASATLGRGYTVAGLNTCLAEFITNTNSTNTTLFNLATVAALYYQLDRPSVAVTVDDITARVNALAKLADLTAVADAALKDNLYTYRYVTILQHPQSLVVNTRSGAIFTVQAIGQPPLAYQWLLNGAPIAGATSSTLSLTNVDSSKTGTYSVVVTSSVTSATSDAATLTLSSTLTKVANLSTRGVTGAGGQLLIGGFVVSGPATQTRQMLVRVVGPSLPNVNGALADPRLEIYNSANTATPILSNDNWGTQTGGAAAVTAIQQAATRVGAFQLPAGSADAAVLATLQPGLYTVLARGPNAAATGVVLIEVYDATPNSTTTTPKPVNVSTRGPVGTGANIMIAGFVITGDASRRILIRGTGPTLTRFNVPGVLADPQIELFDNNGKSLRLNDDWASGDDATLIATAANGAGAFPLANGSKDSAMLLMLTPGAYTVHLSGVNSGTGIGLVEVYDVDP